MDAVELSVNHHRRARQGVTLIELIVVIAVIALLIGLLAPALSGARARSRKTSELHDIRQIGFAWTMYANINNDAALPGFLEPQVQELWEVAYRYHSPSKTTDATPVPPAPDFADGAPNIAGPWTWRLISRLNHNHAVTRGHLADPMLDEAAVQGKAHEIAYEPAFGYNGYYFGGWWYPMQAGNTIRPFVRMAEARDLVNNRRVGVLQQSVSSVGRPSEVLVFVSTTRVDQGVHGIRKMPDDVPGWHLAVPPFLAQEQMWESNSRSTRAFAQTPIPVGRHTGQAAVLFADLNTSAVDPAALNDQRMWIGPATSADWKHREVLPDE